MRERRAGHRATNRSGMAAPNGVPKQRNGWLSDFLRQARY